MPESTPVEIQVPTGVPGQTYKVNAQQNADNSITFQHVPVVNDEIVSPSNPMPTQDTAVEVALGTPADPVYAGGSGSVISILKGIFGLGGGSGGSISIGSVSLEAGSAVIGAVQQAGSWILSAGSALIGGVNIVDAGGVYKAVVTSTGAVIVDGSGVVQPISGTVSLDSTDSNNIATIANSIGTSGTGDSPPTGGNGLLGYLSGAFVMLVSIYTKLTGTIAVTGTFWQATQPVSIASSVTVTGTVTADLSSIDRTNSISLVTLATSTANALGAIGDTAWISGNGSVIALLKTIASGTSGTFTLDSTDSGYLSTTATEITATANATGTTADVAWVSGSGTIIALLKTIATGTSTISGTVSLDTTDSNNLATTATETTATATVLGTQGDSSWVSGNGSIVALLKNMANKLASSIAVTGTFWQATQPVSIASSVAVTGTFWQATQPVSIAAVVNTADAANGSASGGTAATVSELQGAIYNTSLPTLTNGQQAALQSDSSGRLFVNIGNIGTVTANLGTTDTGHLATVATETTATAGAFGTTADVAWVSGSGTAIALLKTIAGGTGGSGNTAPNGSVTGGTAGTASYLSGLVYNTSLPTLTNGQQAALQGDSSGRLIVNVATGTVAVTGTFWQSTQPVSLTSLPALVAGSAVIGGVELVDSGGTNKAAISADGAIKVDNSAVTQPTSFINNNPNIANVTLTTTNGAYSADTCIGGVQEATGIFSSSGGTVKQITLIAPNPSAGTPDLFVIVFYANPSNSTLTDNSAIVISHLDFATCVAGVWPLINAVAPNSNFPLVAQAEFDVPINAANFWYAIGTSQSLTLTTTNQVVAQVSTLK